MGAPLTELQTETIRAAWVLSGNQSYAARQAGCHPSTVSRYVATHREELTQLAREKAPEMADLLSAVAKELVSWLLDGKKLRDARLGEVATALGIVIDKRQLLTGEATERHEHRDADSPRDELARRIDELAERRRARGVAVDSDGRPGAGVAP